ncbi:flagellar filament capping protein FliD [Psychrosphaera ytuae]|uniref:Flagellar hook-associated protein 2 n=1 Tax=Psychrosphaera ytuae TaxID=2820710 RepID=A0A975DBB4_9GAMM|nr:flagellar filament capping protein FliD [Psychrosphaera ytuae]QTH63799.1 flagellar filament capping protein FliD [Psychrosphaera ytuae]
MAALSSPGIGSGLDVNNIVTSLVEATREPVDAQNLAKEETYTAQISDLGKLKSALSDLDNALFDLKLPTTFSKRKVETSSSNFTVEAGSAALPATYDVKVNSLAKAHQITSQSFDLTTPVGEGTLTIQNAKFTFDVEVSASDTLDQVAANINSLAANFGVTATVITGDSGSYLVLGSEETGTDNAIDVIATDIDGNLYDGAGLSRLNFDSKTKVLDQTFTAGEVMNADGVSNGVITLTNGDLSEDITIAATDTIEDVVAKINASSVNVTASLEDDGTGTLRLALTSGNDYGNHQLGISIASDDDGDTADANGVSRLGLGLSYQNFNETREAASAQITVNGAITASSNSNEFADVIEGVVITATAEHSATSSGDSMKVELDQGSTEEAVTAFVESYNAMIAVVKEVTNADESVGDVGSLVSDNTVRTFLSQIRSRLSDAVQVGPNQAMSLSTIGISTERDGTLSLDTTVLSSQINENFENFGALFSGENGVARSVASIVTEYKGIGGIVDNKISTVNGYLDRLADEREKFDEKMVAYENRLFSQFNAMDLIVANLNATSQYLEGALSSLPGVTKKSD